MEVTANKAIIYDDTCPLCVWYTGAFVKTGMLKKDNRISFNELNEKTEIAANMDMHRSKHEIPLVDLKGGETLYGLDSLAFILSEKMPFIAWALQFRPIRAFFKTFYNIVSYNRRVIVGAAKTPTNGFDCTPDFHVVYRLIYIVLGILMGVLGAYSFAWMILYSEALYTIGFINMIFLCVGVAGWGIYGLIALVTIPNNRTKIEYFGQLVTISLMSLGVYVALMGIAAFIPSVYIANLVGAFAVAISFLVACRAHFRRLKVVGLENWRMIVWVLSFVVAAVLGLGS
ncbi:MAG: DCC1-like thiol-disulfide oxidoreductase family protein [Chitinophagales bacterium]